MRRNELKAALGRVRAREELVASTIAAVEVQKKRQEKRYALPSYYSFGLRLAGAACAFVLVFCVGFMAAGQDFDRLDRKTLGQLAPGDMTAEGEVAFALEGECENGYVLLQGSVDSMSFVELTDEDAQNGILKKCKVVVSANELIERSEDLSVDLNKTDATFESYIVFCDHDAMNAFFDQSTEEMLLRVTPDQQGGWEIVNFAPLKK